VVLFNARKNTLPLLYSKIIKTFESLKLAIRTRIQCTLNNWTNIKELFIMEAYKHLEFPKPRGFQSQEGFHNEIKK
jgi:hypothetical protein